MSDDGSTLPPPPRLRARFLRVSMLAVLINCAIYLFSRHLEMTMAGREGRVNLQALAMEAAGNSTLGFGSIQFINIPSRYDRLDAVSLQAHLSGLDIAVSQGVEAADIRDIGMPPTHLPGYVREKEKGCFRAHANIWSAMLRKNLPAVLILESDATWDVNIRDIMSNFNKHFVTFLRQTGSSPLRNAGREARFGRIEQDKGKDYDAQDPWLSKHWDVLSLGHCFELPQDNDIYLAFPDVHAPAGMDYWGLTLGQERVVRKSGGIACLTSYAVSQTGAAKLLLRSAVDLDDSVDMIMRRMILAGHLVAYSTFPTIMAQWQYVDGIGMDQRGANSDIRGKGQAIDENTQMEGWDNVWKSGSAWRPKAGHPDIAFKDMALAEAWKRIFDNASLESSIAERREYY